MRRSSDFPRLRRPDFLTVLSWAAVPAFALALFASTLWRIRPLFSSRTVVLTAGRPAGAALAVLVAVLMALPLGWASRRPVPVLGVLLGEVLVGQVLGEKLWPLYLAADLLLCYLAATLPRRTGTKAFGAVLATWAVVQLLPPDRLWSRLTGPSGNLVVLTVFAWIVGSWLRLRHEHAATLRTRATEQAVQEERLRIARELHDMVAHSIGVIAIQAGAARRVVATHPAEVEQALGAIEETSRETLTGLRRMLGALRRADGDPVAGGPAPGLVDVERLTATAAEAGVRVELRWDGLRRALPPEIELSAFRIIQEAVTNVVRHAAADRCRVSVGFGETELAIEVLDDGSGHPAPSPGGGYGLVGMRERVGLLHGSLEAGPRPEGGFRVAARLPV